ncbi:MAG: hypothetical protein WCY51_08470 [Sulfurimonas sp.]
MSIKSSNTLVKKLSFLFFLLFIIFQSSLNAASTFKGQLVYLKECRVCHLSSKIYLQSHSFEEWSKIVDSAGANLRDIHLKKDEKFVNSKEGIAKSSHKYFKSEHYMQGYKELRSFILESAKRNEEIEAIYK